MCKKEEIAIKPPYIKLTALLKYTGACGTGGEAKIIVTEGDVSVNGETCLVPGRKIYPGDMVRVRENTEFFVTVSC